MDPKLVSRIRALENKTFIPYCSQAEYAKRLKMNGALLSINQNGDMDFSGNMLGKNIKIDNNIKIEKNKADISDLYETKADKDHTHEIEDVEGLQTELDNKADINHTHTTFNNALSIITNSATALTINSTTASALYLNPIQIYNNNLGSGHELNILIGKAFRARQSGYIGFCYHPTDPYMSIGFHSVDRLLNIFTNRVESVNNITAPNLTADNNTRLTTAENLISTKADNSMLSALTARVAAVETGKADITNSHFESISVDDNSTHTVALRPVGAACHARTAPFINYLNSVCIKSFFRRVCLF